MPHWNKNPPLPKWRPRIKKPHYRAYQMPRSLSSYLKPHFWASPALQVGCFIPWYGQNQGLGRKIKKRRGFRQVSIRKHVVLGHALFWSCLRAPQTRFLDGGVSYCVAFGNKSLCIHFQQRGMFQAPRVGHLGVFLFNRKLGLQVQTPKI